MDYPSTEQLERYAQLAVRVGLNLQPGQRLALSAAIESAPLARAITREAYRAGARFVEVNWSDEMSTLIRYQEAPGDSFEELPTLYAERLQEIVKRGDAFLGMTTQDPDLLRGQDPEHIATARNTSMRAARALLDAEGRDTINWTGLSVPVAGWAAKVFPGLPPEEQMRRLWDAVFQACRLDQPDPVQAWREHMANLKRRKEWLDAKRYRRLRFRGPGTDLSIGLPAGHLWVSGGSTSERGIPFLANIPTEEVFTTPHRLETEGVVTATKPLSYYGEMFEDFSLTFEAGRVVKVAARKGEASLRKLMEMDEGAKRLGEVALVPQSSPIARSGILFYDTLYDENAASHVALGAGFQPCMEGGTAMSDEAFAAAGGNVSGLHLDFMIGSGEVEVEGYGEDGSPEPVMRRGEWVD